MEGIVFILSFFIILLSSQSFCDERGARVKRIVGGVPAAPPLFDDPAVFTNFNGKTAIINGVRAFPHYQFRGIKYAFAPVGSERFLRPRQRFLEGEVNATRYPPPCMQPRPGTSMVIGSEDCLALNVFTPELPTGSEGLPVVVWIHGGGFRYGSASQYGARHLVGKQMVVVTIQYRLGSLGFLSSGEKNLPGNVALWDMVLAVQWVRNYIGFFGGNPYKIFVMGHDTGASSALLMALSNIAKGLPAGVIAMSGTAVSKWAIDETPSNTAEEVAKQHGCPTIDTVTMVKCLRNLPAEAIVRGDSNVEFTRLQTGGFLNGLTGAGVAAPVAEGRNDGRSLPGLVEERPLTEMNQANHPKIPLLTGICKDETKRAVEDRFKKDITDKLTTIDNYLDELTTNLKKTIPLDGIQQTINNTLSLIPLNFNKYLEHKKNDLFDALNKVADITGDALFNVPAFLTVDRWSKNGAKTFLYSFDHFGKRLKGDVFLRGSPLVGNGTYSEDLNATVAHGDDLSYLFDAHDINGNPIETNATWNEEDERVRNVFTQMIADFVRHGSPRINQQEVQPFSLLDNNFIQIKSKPTIAKDFKFCEMALWFNMADRLKSTSCGFLDAFNKNIKHATGLVKDVLSNNNGLGQHPPNLNVLGRNQSVVQSLPIIGSNTAGMLSGPSTSNAKSSSRNTDRMNLNKQEKAHSTNGKNPGVFESLVPLPNAAQSQSSRGILFG